MNLKPLADECIRVSSESTSALELLESEDAVRDLSSSLGLTDQFNLAQSLSIGTLEYSKLPNTRDISLTIDFLITL